MNGTHDQVSEAKHVAQDPRSCNVHSCQDGRAHATAQSKTYSPCDHTDTRPQQARPSACILQANESARAPDTYHTMRAATLRNVSADPTLHWLHNQLQAVQYNCGYGAHLGTADAPGTHSPAPSRLVTWPSSSSCLCAMPRGSAPSTLASISTQCDETDTLLHAGGGCPAATVPCAANVTWASRRFL